MLPETWSPFFFHLNARSLLLKIEEFRFVARSSDEAVIGVIGTWMDNSAEDSEVDIPGYIIQRKDRQHTGGGVYTYIHTDLAFNPCIDLVSADDTETVWVEILLLKSHPILTGVCYRPPKQMDFYERLEKGCNLIEHETIILGDLNMNILKSENVLIGALNNFMHLCGLKQLMFLLESQIHVVLLI